MSPVTKIWQRIIEPDQPTLSSALANYFLSIGFTEKEKARYKQLAEKDQVDLTLSERAELEGLVHASTVIMLLQAKARLSLKKQQPAA